MYKTTLVISTSCFVFYFVFVASFLSLLHTPISAQYVNVTADNTFEVYVDNVRVIGPICPDNETGMAGVNPPGRSCFWGTAARASASALRAGSIVAVHARNANGPNTNPLKGGLNPGAFILTVTGSDGTLCSNSDLGASWICTDNLALNNYTGSSIPGDYWRDPAYVPTPGLWGGPLSDLGANVNGSWRYMTTKAMASSWPDSLWYSVIPGGPGPVSGISLSAHWVWYRFDTPNQDIYCRLTVGNDYNCTLPSRSPTPSLSISSSTSISSTSSISISSSTSISSTKSISVSSSATPVPSLSPTRSFSSSTSFSPSTSFSSSISISSSTSISSSRSFSPSTSFSTSRSFSTSTSFSTSSSVTSSASTSASPSPAAVAAGGGGSNTGTIVGAVVGSVVGVAAIAGLAAAAAAAGIIAYKKTGGAPTSAGVNSGSAMFNDVKSSDLYVETGKGFSNPLFQN